MGLVSVWAIAQVFSGEEKLIRRGENARRSQRLEAFKFDSVTGCIAALVWASMKNKKYKVNVSYFIIIMLQIYH